jgi:hypothetical protein
MNNGPMKFSGIEARHADKGSWQINKDELIGLLPDTKEREAEANKILAIIKETCEELGLDKNTLALKPEGLIRARKLGEKVFNLLPLGRSFLVVIDSNKPRAALTSAEAVGKIHEMEKTQKEKTVDMIKVDEEKFTQMMLDEGTETWPKFEKIMEAEGISESQAIARQVNEITGKTEKELGIESPEEAENRYRKIIQILKRQITGEDNPRVIVFGVGHSGPLALIRRKEAGQDIGEENVPQFCEIHMVGEDGKLIGTEKVNLENENQ